MKMRHRRRDRIRRAHWSRTLNRAVEKAFARVVGDFIDSLYQRALERALGIPLLLRVFDEEPK